ncbi:glycosyltransferase family 10 domain-containing protein [Chitinophaga flava]|uniref:Fucosyltransferase C-terminal domain-containing protein n=1 Tax=Chitinophaga flava TaxID=2259036 RepID=A0A365XV48_9BACT|nr:glycosyltransferase family 10 [Chitinophaga flava]RBL89465.1 hypothetical protein DF182_23405 [Chitinophaga flava]
MKVRVTCFWDDDSTLLGQLSRYAFGKAQWKDMQLVTNEDYDVLVILTSPHPSLKEYNKEKAVTLLTEPPQSAHIQGEDQSGKVPVYLHLPFWGNIPDEEIKHLSNTGVPKSELLSAVTSELGYMEGHQLRLQVIYHLSQKINEGFDLWGKKYTNHFFEKIHAYRGELTNKYDGLWDYQYHFACENTFIDNYFTEKLTDPILAEALCFYDGCQNIEDFIDPRSFIRINVQDPVTATERIIQAINDEEWEQRIPYIREQKQRLLRDLNPLNIIWLAASGQDVIKACKL